MERAPSPLRAPVAVVLFLVAPPLGLLAWILLSGSARRTYWRSAWVGAGLGTMVVASVPLLVVIVANDLGLWPDPNPNPVGFGLLFVAGAMAGTVLLGVGVVGVARRAY